MTRRRVVLAATVAVLAATVALLGGALRGSSAGASGVPSPGGFEGPLPSADTAGLVRELQAKLRAHNRDAHSFALLGLAYEQRARETGDPAYYSKADGVLERALRLSPNDLVALSGLGSLALSRHRFREALWIGERAHRLSPTTARTYGLVGDAQLELGRYSAAFRSFNQLAALRPGLAAYARVSYARELLGETDAAINAMKLALDAAASEPEPTAWAHVQLGKLYWSVGKIGAAGTQYRAALFAFPGYVYAYDALAQVAAARGRLRAAVAFEQRAVQAIPLPQFVGSLGDLYRLSGRERAAQREYALVDVIHRLLVANGVKTDLETALFDVDHASGLPRALALARLAHRERPSIDGDDVLAWAFARNGRCGDALDYSQRALRLGTHDALKYFHRGMIERCLGHRSAARFWLGRALRLNPNFSLLWAPVARRLVG